MNGLRRIFLVLATATALGGCAATDELRDFTTDGCSLFPDAAGGSCWVDCCVAHDRAYWRGGTAEERQRADVALRECVLAQTGKPVLAGAMYHGVRVGGGPFVPAWYRWGYGWGYGRGYAPLTDAERRQADDRLAAHRPAEPHPSCAEGAAR